MKRLLAILLIAMMLNAGAFAAGIPEFLKEYNSWAANYFKIPALDEHIEDVYISNGMLITFLEENGSVYAAVCAENGQHQLDNFFSTVMCLLYTLDPGSSESSYYNSLMSAYFRCCTRAEEGLKFHSYTDTGAMLEIWRENGLYYFDLILK